MTTTEKATRTRNVEPPEFDIAHKLNELAGAILIAGTTPAAVTVLVQYLHGDTASVDMVAAGISAPPGTRARVNGSLQHEANLSHECLTVAIYCGVTEQPAAKRDRLRRELADLDAQIGAWS